VPSPSTFRTLERRRNATTLGAKTSARRAVFGGRTATPRSPSTPPNGRSPLAVVAPPSVGGAALQLPTPPPLVKGKPAALGDLRSMRDAIVIGLAQRKLAAQRRKSLPSRIVATPRTASRLELAQHERDGAIARSRALTCGANALVAALGARAAAESAAAAARCNALAVVASAAQEATETWQIAAAALEARVRAELEARHAVQLSAARHGGRPRGDASASSAHRARVVPASMRSLVQNMDANALEQQIEQCGRGATEKRREYEELRAWARQQRASAAALRTVL
jgi:hypothetical protein